MRSPIVALAPRIARQYGRGMVTAIGCFDWMVGAVIPSRSMEQPIVDSDSSSRFVLG
jgi:hypothetical protein